MRNFPVIWLKFLNDSEKNYFFYDPFFILCLRGPPSRPHLSTNALRRHSRYPTNTAPFPLSTHLFGKHFQRWIHWRNGDQPRRIFERQPREVTPRTLCVSLVGHWRQTMFSNQSITEHLRPSRRSLESVFNAESTGENGDPRRFIFDVNRSVVSLPPKRAFNPPKHLALLWPTAHSCMQHLPPLPLGYVHT